MNKEKFLASIRGKTVLADFSAPWCGPCRMMAPVMAEITREFKDTAAFVDINIDTHKGLATELMVQSIPTLIFFKDGQEVKRLVGLQPKALILENLEKLIQAPR